MYLLFDVDLSGVGLAVVNLALVAYTLFYILLCILSRETGYSVGKIILILFGSFFLWLDYDTIEALLESSRGVLKELCHNDPSIVVWQTSLFYISVVVLYLLPLFLKRVSK
jgi:hypothetical protein